MWRTGPNISSSGFPLVRGAGTGKCPVCGDPGSNCSSGKDSPKILLNDEAPPEKQIIRVQEDVVVERKVGPNTVREVRARKGDYLNKEEAERLGLAQQ